MKKPRLKFVVEIDPEIEGNGIERPAQIKSALQGLVDERFGSGKVKTMSAAVVRKLADDWAAA